MAQLTPHAAIMRARSVFRPVMGADIQPPVLHRRTLVVGWIPRVSWWIPSRCSLQEYQRLISEENEFAKLAEDDRQLPAQPGMSGERKVMFTLLKP